jgi:ribosomal protein S18 acetylase RimI-like enzyme
MNEKSLHRLINRRDVIGVTSTIALPGTEVVAGFMAYSVDKHRLEILRLAVREDCRRHGVGTYLMQRIRSKAAMSRRGIVTAMVPERNMGAIKFFRSVGMRATCVQRNWFPETAEDGYLFEIGAG